jgi:hypothetical protein
MPKPTFDQLKDTRINEIGLTVEEIKRNTDESIRLLDEADAIHNDYARVYDTKDRAATYLQGLVHSEDESKSIDAIIDTSEAHPEYVKSLAQKDGGSDPDILESHLLYARLEAVKHIQAAAQRAQEIANSLFDTAASIGLNAKPITQAAYRILKPLSDTDTKVQKRLMPAIKFHRDRGGKRSDKNPK